MTLNKIEKQGEEKDATFSGLLNYNTRVGNIFLLIGIVVSLVNGCVIPVFA